MILTLSGNIIQIEKEKCKNIEDIKFEIKKIKRIEPDKYRLIYDNEFLEEKRPLSYYKIN